MFRTFRAAAVAAGLAGASFLAPELATAQWGHAPGPTYFHAPYAAGGYGYQVGPSPRYSLYAPTYDFATPSYGYPAPVYGYSSLYAPTAPAAPMYGYGGTGLGRPHGELEYDVYTPFGRQEVEYHFRRNGTVRVDVDD